MVRLEVPVVGSGTSAGAGGGVGAGDGSGVGPGGSPRVPVLPIPGSGAGAGSTGGTPSTPTSVTTKPRLLNAPRPRYIEVARNNQTMGVVVLRLTVGADGNVKRVVITKGLPDGLDERALEAAYELKFQPATRDGVAVDYTLTIQVEFNLR